MLDIILATRDIYFEKALREIFGTVSSRIRYIEDAISDRRRVQSGRSFRYYFVFCDDEYTDIVRILFTGEACCILNKSMLNLRASRRCVDAGRAQSGTEPVLQRFKYCGDYRRDGAE
ncbi:hypothetical protein O5290_25150 [Escherichia coli]|nr:hypothetical protein [Escherichia coli]